MIGRPVDVAEGPDGAFYVSDDYAGVIYRVSTNAHPGAESDSPIPLRPSPGQGTDPLAGLDPADRRALVDRGEPLFAVHACGSCHLESQATEGVVVKPLAALADRYTLESMAAFFLAPQPPMPLFELSEDERRALAGYLLENYGR